MGSDRIKPVSQFFFCVIRSSLEIASKNKSSACCSFSTDHPPTLSRSLRFTASYIGNYKDPVINQPTCVWKLFLGLEPRLDPGCLEENKTSTNTPGGNTTTDENAEALSLGQRPRHWWVWGSLSREKNSRWIFLFFFPQVGKTIHVVNHNKVVQQKFATPDVNLR